MSPSKENILSHWHASTPFAAANPVYFLDLCSDYPGTPEAVNLVRFLAGRTLLGHPDKVRDAWCKCAATEASDLPRIQLPRHVFPVHLDDYGVAMLVPLHFRPAEEWSAPEVLAGLGASSPAQGLMDLLAAAEKRWSTVPGRRPLPLRWRHPFAVAAGCHLHFQSIEENSFELPLLVALLRELCIVPTRSDPPSVPFGDGPVFATGKVGDGEDFGAAGALGSKLRAFVREAPVQSPALLTPAQIEHLRDHSPDLLPCVRPICIESLTELFDLDAFREGMERLAGPPHPSEIDELLWNMDRLARGIRFADSAAIANWLLPYVSSPGYRVRLLVHAAAASLHAGHSSEVNHYSRQIRELIPCGDLGSDQRVRAVAFLGTQAFRIAEWEEGLEQLARIEPELTWCGASSRVRFFGSRSRLLRALGRWDEAVESAEVAFELAQRAASAEAGMYLNFLIHALLRRAAARSSRDDLDRAARLLEDSAGKWVPLDDENRRLSHIGFCKHLRAEWARLAETCYDPGDQQTAWPGMPEHPRLFELLACVRNPSCERDLRLEYGRTLLQTADHFRTEASGLFIMFRFVYRAYVCTFEGVSSDDDIRELESWCQQQAQLGLPGWNRRLHPLLYSASRDLEWAGRLCDAIPQH